MSLFEVLNVSEMALANTFLAGVSSRLVYVGNACDSYPCWNDAFCVPLNSTKSPFRCICGSQHSGDQCQYKITDYCAESSCPSGRECTVRNGLPECIERDTLGLLSSCDDNLCLNGGHCFEVSPERHRCVCDNGYHGAFCQFAHLSSFRLPQLSAPSILFLAGLAFLVVLSIAIICHSSSLGCYLITPGERNYVRWEQEDDDDDRDVDTDDSIPLEIMKSQRVKASVTADTIVDLDDPATANSEMSCIHNV